MLRRRPKGYFWAEPGIRPTTVDLRGGGGGQVAIVDEDSARLLGTVDLHRAPSAVHAGAVHLHRGESYVVQDLDLREGVALVRRGAAGLDHDRPLDVDRVDGSSARRARLSPAGCGSGSARSR